MSDPTDEEVVRFVTIRDSLDPAVPDARCTDLVDTRCIRGAGIIYEQSSRMMREDNPFDAELIKMLDIFRAKNADYSGSDQKDPLKNFKSAADLGVDPVVGILIRMSDKWMRIQNLTRTGKQSVKDEALEDTLRDLANYAILAIMAMKDAKKEGGK